MKLLDFGKPRITIRNIPGIKDEVSFKMRLSKPFELNGVEHMVKMILWKEDCREMYCTNEKSNTGEIIFRDLNFASNTHNLFFKFALKIEDEDFVHSTEHCTLLPEFSDLAYRGTENMEINNSIIFEIP